MRIFLIFLAGFGLWACKSAPKETPAPSVLDHVVLTPVRAEAVIVKLSGDEFSRRDWQESIETNLTDALEAVFSRAGTTVERAAAQDFDTLLTRAEVVLPQALRGGEIPLAGGIDHWSLGATPYREQTVLVVTHSSSKATTGHQLAEIGLGLAFANPLIPGQGENKTYAALIEGGSGDLIWVEEHTGGDARSPEGAQKIANSILERVEANGP
ncbi:MAG: hypothetical protein AAF829_01950 [Pseudomonadota bacterium]